MSNLVPQTDDAQPKTGLAQTLQQLGAGDVCIADLATFSSQIPQDPAELLKFVALVMKLATTRLTEGDDKDKLDPQTVAIIQQQVREFLAATITGLPTVEFKPHIQHKPAGGAKKLFKEMLDVETANVKKENRKAEKIYACLDELFKKIASAKNTPLTEIHEHVLNDLAKYLAKVSEISLYDLKERLLSIESFRYPPFSLRANDLEEALSAESQVSERDKKSLQGRLIEAVNGKVGPSEAFGVLYTAADDYTTMDPASLWNRGQIERTSGPNSELQYDNIRKMALDANDLIKNNVGFELASEVEKEQDLKKLRKLALVLPTTPVAFHIMQSALVKLETMHILLVINSEVDFERNGKIGQHLSKFMQHLSKDYEDETVFNYPTTGEGEPIETLDGSTHHVDVDRIEVDEKGKPLFSLFAKVLIDGLISTRKVFDHERARMYCRYKDSHDDDGNFDEAKFKNWVLHTLSVLLSVLGNDIDKDRLRCSIVTGGTNPDSTGKHRGVQLTIIYKHGIWDAEINPDGSPRISTSLVEMQLLAFSTPEDEDEDHANYSKNKTRLLGQKLGTAINFTEFTTDLLTVLDTPNYGLGIDHQPESPILPDKLQSFVDRRDGIADIDSFPQDVDISNLLNSGRVPNSANNERVALLLLEILTATNKDSGKLVNKPLVRGLMKTQKTLLENVVERCLGWTRDHPDSKFGALIEHRAGLIARRLKMLNDGTLQEECLDYKIPDVESKLIIQPNSKGKTLVLKRTFFDVDAKKQSQMLPWDGPTAHKTDTPTNNGTILFYDTSEKETLTYIIKPDQAAHICYLSLNGSQAQADLIPIWRAEVISDADGANSVIQINQYEYAVMTDAANGSKIVVHQLKREEGAVRKLMLETELTPAKGMDSANARAYTLLGEFKKRRINEGRTTGKHIKV